MAFDFDVSPLKDFLDQVAHGATATEWLWQLGVGAAAVGLGFLAARVICKQVTPSPRWKFGEGDFERVAYPLLTYLFMAVGRAILARHQQTVLLDIVQSLLIAWVVIRIAIYILGHILPQGGFLRASIRAVAWIAWIGVALHVTGLLPGVIQGLEDVGLTVGADKQRITLWLILQAVAALALTLALAAWISRITESRVLAAKDLEMSTRVVITKAVRVATLFLAILVALPLVGIPITALSVFSGALGVGLGFGLQKIASNYISGFIVLIDRSLRIGDVVMVDGRRGEVKAIESRYTVIKGADGVESIIPNEKLITESVNHHTYSDPKVSVVLGVFISYESDVQKACDLLIQFARGHTRVIPDPPPTARIKQLADHGVELELTVWIKDPAVGEADLKSALFRDILDGFKTHGIEIPWPRRDIRVIATGATDKALDPSRT